MNDLLKEFSGVEWPFFLAGKCTVDHSPSTLLQQHFES